MGDYTIKFKTKIMPYNKKNKSVGGRKANRIEKITKRRDIAYSKASDKSIKMGADTPFDMGVGTDTRAYKKSERLSQKIEKLENRPLKGLTSRGSKYNA